MPEAIIDPAQRIVDPHHHLWDRRNQLASMPNPPVHAFGNVTLRWPRYLLDELLADTNSGHNIVATVFIECRAMYRADAPEAFKPVGETEFVNGIAAMSASTAFGKTKICHGIVGHVDLLLGAKAGEVLDAHIQAGGGRFRGIRHSASWDADPNVLGPLALRPEGLFRNPKFREGFAQLAPRKMSFEAWMLEPQLPDLIDLARAFPDTQIVLDHVGTPLGIASYQGKREERFPAWRENIRILAKLPNLHVKLGGLAMPFCNFASCLSEPRAPSSQLAKEWAPYIETCIEAFGPKRSMFESNFPVDEVSCSYAALWNALKLVARSYSAEERDEMFFGTANRFYRLGL